MCAGNRRNAMVGTLLNTAGLHGKQNGKLTTRRCYRTCWVYIPLGVGMTSYSMLGFIRLEKLIHTECTVNLVYTESR